MTLLTRDQILTADDLRSEIVPVPEWGGDVRVAALTGTERDRFETSFGDGKTKNLDNVRAKLVAKSIVDEDGQRIFSDADVVKLGLKNAAALDRVFDVAQRLSGLTKQDVDDLAGNSDAAPSGASTSDSPHTSD